MRTAPTRAGEHGFTSAMDPSHVVYRASRHIPSTRGSGDRFRSLEAVGADVQDSDQCESCGATFQNYEAVS